MHIICCFMTSFTLWRVLVKMATPPIYPICLGLLLQKLLTQSFSRSTVQIHETILTVKPGEMVSEIRRAWIWVSVRVCACVHISRDDHLSITHDAWGLFSLSPSCRGCSIAIIDCYMQYFQFYKCKKFIYLLLLEFGPFSSVQLKLTNSISPKWIITFCNWTVIYLFLSRCIQHFSLF